MIDFSDPKILIYLRNRDPNVWDAFFEQTAPKLKEWVIRKLRREEFVRNLDAEATAEDVVSEAITKALEKIEQYDINRPLMPWFWVIAGNALTDVLRDLKHQSFYQATPITRDSDESIIEATEKAEQLCRELGIKGMLSEKDVLYIQWIFVDNIETKIIAEKLGITDSAVRQAKKRLLDKLKRVLQNAG